MPSVAGPIVCENHHLALACSYSINQRIGEQEQEQEYEQQWKMKYVTVFPITDYANWVCPGMATVGKGILPQVNSLGKRSS